MTSHYSDENDTLRIIRMFEPLITHDCCCLSCFIWNACEWDGMRFFLNRLKLSYFSFPNMILFVSISRLLTGSINLLFYLPKFIQRGLGWTIFYWGTFQGVRRTCPGTHIPLYTDAHDFFTSSPVSSLYILWCWQYIPFIFFNLIFRSASSSLPPPPPLSPPLSFSLMTISYSSLPLWRLI